MNELLRPKRLPFPPVVNPNATRLPRGASYSNERDAGRCLIALVFQRVKYRNSRRVLVRNCHRGTVGNGDNLIVVENVREFLPRKKTNRSFVFSRFRGRMGNTGLPLLTLTKMGIHPLRRPFMVAEPHPNCMAEMSADDFTALWDAHVVAAKPSISKFYHATPDETPMLRLFRLHWREQQVRENWTPERVRRLCALWNLTPHELAELIQWSPGGMNTFLGNTATVAGVILPGPVALWFYFLENTKLGINVFPALPQTEALAS